MIGCYKETKEIINKYNFVIKKNFGQNFLIDNHVIQKIIRSADIQKDDVVLEIGPGFGALTQVLLQNAHKVIAIEIDRNLIQILKDNFMNFDNIEIINDDILNVDIKSILQKYPDKNIKIVANLPYYITTPIIMLFLESNLKIKSLTIMIQKEVAKRLISKPSTKEYGAITLAISYYTKPYIVANVPKNCFLPRPNVDSSVIRLDLIDKLDYEILDKNLMFSIIKYAFLNRRKTLANCLYQKEEIPFEKDKIHKMISLSGLRDDIRGENLSLKQFATLSDIIFKNIKKI